MLNLAWLEMRVRPVNFDFYLFVWKERPFDVDQTDFAPSDSLHNRVDSLVRELGEGYAPSKQLLILHHQKAWQLFFCSHF